MERKPIRTRLQNRVIKGSAIAPSTITAEEVDFGTALVTSENPADVIDTPKEGLLIINPNTNSASVYSEAQGDYVDVTDPAAQATADSKNASYYQDNAPAGTAHEVGDLWIDTNDNDKLYSWDGATWSLAQDSAAASSAATTAYNAAIASLQPSANTIVNASNQITAVNTNGITVYSGSSATTGARIVMNSAGIAGFDATSTNSSTGATFSISASTGAAVFKGSIQSGSSISGADITGGTIKTAASGSRIEMSSSDASRISFYGSSTAIGAISVTDHRMFIYAPGSSYGSGAYMTMYSDQYASVPNGLNIYGGTSNSSRISMSSTSILIERDNGTHTLTLDATSVRVGGTAVESASALRNIRITQTAPSSGSDSSSYPNGSVLLVREA